MNWLVFLVRGRVDMSNGNRTDVRRICSVSDAMEVIFDESKFYNSPNVDVFSKKEPPGDSCGVSSSHQNKVSPDFPFKIWFRGQTDEKWGLVPAVFRAIGNKRYDEQKMFYHFQNENPSYEGSHTSAFDWLCLMQHYNLPTRLLDWTENMLVALFFSVYDPYCGDFACNDKYDGAIYAIDPEKLNCETRVNQVSLGICSPNSADVVIRSHMALSKSVRDLYFQMKKSGVFLDVCEIFGFPSPLDIKGFESQFNSQFLGPVAVFPKRINLRMTPQASVFTIFGSVKRVDEENKAFIDDGLLDLTRSKFSNTLKKFIIPKEKKEKIRMDLRKIGMHIGTVFPELEYKAKAISENCLV